MEREERELYENEYEIAQREALERIRQEEEKRQLEDKKQAEMLLQQIEELKLREAEVIFSFTSCGKEVPSEAMKCGNADLTSSLQISPRLN